MTPTPARRRTLQKYNASKKRQAARRRYRSSEKYQETRRRYESTEAYKEKRRIYCQSKTRKIAESVRANQRRAKHSVDLSPEEWALIQEMYNHRCAYCGTKIDLTMDHIVPISSNGAHSASNVVPACHSCNSSKGSKSLLLWLYNIRARQLAIV